MTKNLDDTTCGTKKGKEMLAGERGSLLLTLSGVALKLTGVYGVIQGKYHTFGRSDALIPCACSVPGANLTLVKTDFFQSRNFLTKFKLASDRLTSRMRISLDTFQQNILYLVEG